MSSPTAFFFRLLLVVNVVLAPLSTHAMQQDACTEDHDGHRGDALHEYVMDAGSAMDADDHGCCDQEKSAKLGKKVCKPGEMQCQAPAFALGSEERITLDPDLSPPLFAYGFSFPPPPAAVFWRPPQA